jgi:hypothetical protein
MSDMSTYQTLSAYELAKSNTVECVRWAETYAKGNEHSKAVLRLTEAIKHQMRAMELQGRMRAETRAEAE